MIPLAILVGGIFLPKNKEEKYSIKILLQILQKICRKNLKRETEKLMLIL